MPIHFTEKELEGRRNRACRLMAQRDLDGMLLFRQESMYYLTGFDTFGYCFYQCLYLGADGKLTLLTRLPDALVARQTSMIKDIRVWTNLPDANPSLDLRDILAEHGCKGKRLGIELDAYGLTAQIYERVRAALQGFCNLEDASDLVSLLRVKKSAAELRYVRRAAELADAALVEANHLAVPGAFEGDILAAMQSAVFRGDGDYSGNEFIIGAGPRALLGRYYAGRGHIGKNDQLTVEWAGVYRRYHAAMMRTTLTGKPKPRQLDMHKRCRRSALGLGRRRSGPARRWATFSTPTPGSSTRRATRRTAITATGYSMGTTYPPTWMDWPMFYHGNPVIIEPGMVFFIHTLIFDEPRKLAMAPGQSYIVTKTGNEPLSKMSLDLVIN